MSQPRTRDDFTVWALAEAGIARRALGLDAAAIDRRRLLHLARVGCARGGSLRKIDWKRLVSLALADGR